MAELAVVPHLQYSYVPGAAPLRETFEPIARWFDEGENSPDREDVVVRLDISPLLNRRHYLGTWTPKRTTRAVERPELPHRRHRIGFLKGQISVPDDFDTMFQAEIEAMFEG